MEARRSSSEISIGCLNSIEESLRKQVNCVDQFELGIQSKPLYLLAKDYSKEEYWKRRVAQWFAELDWSCRKWKHFNVGSYWRETGRSYCNQYALKILKGCNQCNGLGLEAHPIQKFQTDSPPPRLHGYQCQSFNDREHQPTVWAHNRQS